MDNGSQNNTRPRGTCLRTFRPHCVCRILHPREFESNERLYQGLVRLVKKMNRLIRRSRGVMTDKSMFVLIEIAHVVLRMSGGLSSFVPDQADKKSTDRLSREPKLTDRRAVYPASDALKIAVIQFIHRLRHSTSTGLGPAIGEFMDVIDLALADPVSQPGLSPFVPDQGSRGPKSQAGEPKPQAEEEIWTDWADEQIQRAKKENKYSEAPASPSESVYEPMDTS